MRLQPGPARATAQLLCDHDARHRRPLERWLLQPLDALWQLLGSRLLLSAALYVCLAPLVELAFYLNVRRFIRVRSRQPHRTRSSAADNAEVRAFWMHLLSEESPERLDDMIRGWFIDPEREHRHAKLNPLVSSPTPRERSCGEPCAGNVLELIAWTLFNHDLASLSVKEHEEAEQVLHRLEAVRGAPYLPGRDPKLVCMRHTLGELEMVWKPFIFYLGALMLQRLAEVALRSRGFRLHHTAGLDYWHLPRETNEVAEGKIGAGKPQRAYSDPIVLMHGVGGLTPYVPFCFSVAAKHACDILVPCFPSCSIRVPTLASPPPMPTAELVAAIELMVVATTTGVGAGPGPCQLADPEQSSNASAASTRAAHPIAGSATRIEHVQALLSDEASPPSQATFVAHSMGTAFLAALLRARPGLASSVLFVDPVCFLLYRRDVLYNFLYRKPALRRSWYRPSKWFNLALHRLLTREPCMQCCFRRDFWWSQYLLHPWDVPCDAAVLLSGHDAIVNARDVQRYLSEQEAGRKRNLAANAPIGDRQLRVEMHERRSHGWLMAMPHIRRGVLEVLASLRQLATTRRYAARSS